MITDRLKAKFVNCLVNREIIDWKDKLEKTRAEIAEQDKILVAFSGGEAAAFWPKLAGIFWEKCTPRHPRLGNPVQE